MQLHWRRWPILRVSVRHLSLATVDRRQHVQASRIGRGHNSLRRMVDLDDTFSGLLNWLAVEQSSQSVRAMWNKRFGQSAAALRHAPKALDARHQILDPAITALKRREAVPHLAAGQESGQEWGGKYATLCYIWTQIRRVSRGFCKRIGFSKSGAPQGVVRSNPMPSAFAITSSPA